jgi:ribonuclease D
LEELNMVKERGLSELVRLCFGKPLNKSEQISNWEKRPLRKSQIIYAALDAFCVLEVLDYFSNRLKTLKMEFDINKCIGKKFKNSSKVKQTSREKKNDQKQLKFEISQNEKYQEEVSKFQVIES